MFFWTADSFRNSADFTSAPCQQRDDLRPLPGNMFHVQENNTARLTISLSRSSWKASFRHSRVPSSASALFRSLNAICQVKMSKRKGGDEASVRAPSASASVCVCVSLPLLLFLFFFAFFYIMRNWSVVSAFRYSALIRCCQPASRGGTQGLSKTLLINKPPNASLPAFTALAHLP